MKIKYRNRYLNINLALGLMWLVWFMVTYFTSEEINWSDYGLGLFSLVYFGWYFYQRHYKYLTITETTIKVNRPFGKKMNLSDIDRIRKFAGDYILKTDKNELVINTKIVDSDSLTDLDAELQKLNVTWH
ncbi:MAG: hypothetical protein VX772_02600 [Bacteroidota bacterium]|uniref:PH domain-containing protein n=1 Tax=Flagellimonas okinawensis TaxID=3031324 RepID=A0ABT5XKN9_9FLAO|nr:hypothetical protein [[Muricauda] okinawensis]MDF0706456.1 hypothetical protein [[Muricauda] okinawensis]MEC8831223.1 hypothetical protein [Bacteroidota bacterium]